MNQQTEASIEIAAPAEEIMAVIEDFESYPGWVDSLTAAEVMTWTEDHPDTVRMVLDAGPISDDYTLQLSWPDALTARWHLIQGRVLSAMDGAYELEPLGDDTTTVTYTLAVELAVPLPTPVRRAAERKIIDGALRGLKKRVEG